MFYWSSSQGALCWCHLSHLSADNQLHRQPIIRPQSCWTRARPALAWQLNYYTVLYIVFDMEPDKDPCLGKRHTVSCIMNLSVFFSVSDHQKLDREARICRLLKHSNIGEFCSRPIRSCSLPPPTPTLSVYIISSMANAAWKHTKSTMIHKNVFYFVSLLIGLIPQYQFSYVSHYTHSFTLPMK